MDDYDFALEFLRQVLRNTPRIDASIATAQSNRFKFETAYQVMTSDDFFDWYCYRRPNNQFFEKPMMAVQEYLKYKFIWIELGSPNPF